MKRSAFVILLVGVFVVALAAPGHAAPRHGFSGGRPGGHVVDHRGFDGHRHFRHDRVRIFVSPFFFAAPFVAAPVFVSPPPPLYWYYCRSYGGYYPYVPSCPEPWVPVPAS
jgi:hypothetical protein